MANQQNLRTGRFSQAGNYYHITFRIDQNRDHLSFLQSCIVAQVITSKKHQNHFSLTAWVIMPDHVHLLFQLNGNKTLSQVMSLLKSQSALALNKETGIKAALWQKGFYDHAIRSDESLINVARYIVANPLRAGLVKSVRQYPFWDSIYLD